MLQRAITRCIVDRREPLMAMAHDFASTRSASGLGRYIGPESPSRALVRNGTTGRHEGAYHDEATRWKRAQPVMHLRGTRTVTRNSLTGCDSPLNRDTARRRDLLTVAPQRAFRVGHVTLHGDDMRKVAARGRLQQPRYADPDSYAYGLLQPQDGLPNRAAFSCPQRGDARLHPVDKADMLRAASLLEVERALAATQPSRSASLTKVSSWDNTNRNVTATLWRPSTSCR